MNDGMGNTPGQCNNYTASLLSKAPELTSESAGFASSSHLRWLTPLVLEWNLSGKSAAKSGSSCERMSDVCSSATPLIACDPTVARTAMRAILGLLSSMMLS